MSCLILLILISLSTLSCVSLAQDLNFNFPTFFYENFSDLTLSGSSGMSSGALQVTFDSGMDDDRKYYNMGRIMYNKRPLRLWDPAYNFTASFKTSFVVNMQPSDNTGDNVNRSLGGGMAFLMVPALSGTYCPGDCSRQWLGLFTAQNNGTSAPPMVAIEFDTFKDSFDPDDNHVGIDLNSIVSYRTARAPVNLSDGNTSVWVDYDGHAKRLDVYLAPGDCKGDKKPVDSALSVDLDLRNQFPQDQDIIMGFSGSTGSYFQTHCVLRWEFSTTEGIPVNGRNVLMIALPSALGALVALVLMAVALVLTHRAALRRLTKQWPDFTYGPRKFIFKDLKKATSNFSRENMLGKGGFGTVYKGILSPPGNTPIAVKRICSTSSQGEQEFIAEITTIGRLRHRNLLPLVGWYHDHKGKNLLLVYEYMPNGSLDKWLFTHQDDVFLHWHLRYKIMHGLGRALRYLHEEWEQVVVHRDVKASNVMLDFEFNARLGDFGLARLITDREEEATRCIAGTVGYMAPECVETGIITPESDVYSFGAVALEVACGRRPYAKETGFLAHWVWQLHREDKLLGAADKRLGGAYDEDEMRRLLMVGLACCSADPRRRPSMRVILQSLSEDAPLLQVAHDSTYAEISSLVYPADSSTPSTSETRLLISSALSDRSTFMTATQIVGR